MINSGLHDYTSIQEITETVTSKDTSSAPPPPACVCSRGGRGQVRTEKKARNTTEPQWKQKPARVVSFGGMYTVFLLKMTLPGVTRHL